MYCFFTLLNGSFSFQDLIGTRGKKMSDMVLKRTADMKFQAVDVDKSGDIDELEFLVIYSEMMIDFEKLQAS